MLIDEFDEKADDIAYPRIATPVINEEGEQDNTTQKENKEEVRGTQEEPTENGAKVELP